MITMKKPTSSTIILIIAIIIIGLYGIAEVDYYSQKIASEENITSPVVTIPSIGVNEKINEYSPSYGVYHGNESFLPTEGDVVLYGHRTLQGSPFLRLNEVNTGDIITLNWPNIGQINYTVTNQTIVPATYVLTTTNNTNQIYLITCDPIGSTANRLIITGNLTNQGELDNQIIQNNPQQHNALIILLAFLAIGLILSYFYPKDNRLYILAIILIIVAIMLYFYFFPIPSDILYSKISWLNGDI